MTNTKKVKAPTGYVVYKGASQLNGAPIVAILTMKSGNTKTGNMAQLWILLEDVYPGNVRKVDNADYQKDEAICGNCPFRQSKGGACYVNLAHGPRAVYAAYKENKYPTAKDYSIFEGLNIRFGAYGDIAAIPMSVVVKLKSVAKNNTSYTHQWKDVKNDSLKSLSMASVDNLEEAELAKQMGWRWFRVSKDITDLRKDEIICPNTTKGIQCKDCGLCSGGSTNVKSIVIEVHGVGSKKFKGEDALSLA